MHARSAFIFILYHDKIFSYTSYLIRFTFNCTLSDDNFRLRIFIKIQDSSLIEPVHEKINNFGFRTGPTQTGLYRHRRWLEAGNFGFRK